VTEINDKTRGELIDAERLEIASKLVQTPSEENFLKAICILKEIEKSGYSDPLWTREAKKKLIMAYMSLLENRALECYLKKQYSQALEIFNDLEGYILKLPQELGINLEQFTKFAVELLNALELASLESGSNVILLNSEAHRTLKEKIHNKAIQLYGDRVESSILEMFVRCSIMADTIKRTVEKNENKP
jgi:hypothetical protein